ncbi:ATP-binding protein [Shimia thalassica]|uniref:AAA family ATPase n=1 Tax=Shimia thalassica TaxID=1715693 RepID=UPI0027325AD7|nr:ATP-binding protein [Shimia thalassica]MDP2581310.1 ATP-binding protein [Shimia thalassica]
MTPRPPAMLHILAGKIAAGKSTLSNRLSAEPNTVVIAEDLWLSELFGPEMNTISDYVRFSSRLRNVMAGHTARLLNAGTSVVLDFGANTLESRAWLHDILKDTRCDHILHFLDVPTEVCRERVRARNAAGTHPFSVTDAQFDQITKHFLAPTEAEGFNIRRYTG